MNVNQNVSYIIVKIKGIIKSGSGESSQWMPKYLPWLFPGTVNIKLQGKHPAINYTNIIETDYGKPCKTAPCKVNGADAFIVFPPLAKEHKGKIEIGATFKIRDKFNLKDEDQLEIEFL